MTDPAAPGSDASDVPSRFQLSFEGKTLLGIYRIDRRLAEGGMGSVWLAQDTNLGRRVVVKVPHVRFLGEPGFRSRFRREVAELVRLEHPHVVRILAQGEEDEVPFFVLQYLGGGSLETQLARGAQSPEVALSWLEPIALTLDFVHARGVVHRDVKPANILFDEQGHVFLSDFGVVKALEAEDDANLTEMGTGIGSPYYMAPEQALGRGLSAASDQYALASTLYEALAGSPPFGRGALLELVLKKDKQPAPPIRDLVPSVPPECDAALARALSRDPAMRFASCADFVTAFRSGIARADTTVVAAPLRRRWFAFAAVALLLIAGIGVGAATGWYGLAPPSAAQPDRDAETAGMLIRLAKPGEAPRRILRLRPAAGTTERETARFDHRTTMRSPDIPELSLVKTTTDLDVEQRVTVDVSSVDPDGHAHLRWKVDPPRVIPREGASAEETARAEDIAAKIGAIEGTTTLGVRGISTNTSFHAVTAAGTSDPQIEGLVAGFSERVQESVAPLPAEPVGVGAVWDVTRLVSIAGLRFQATSTYTIVAIDGDQVTLQVHESHSAPPQGMDFGSGDEKRSMSLKSLAGSADGQMVVDLSRVLCVSSELKGEMRFETTATARGGKEATLKFVNRSRYSMKHD